MAPTLSPARSALEAVPHDPMRRALRIALTLGLLVAFGYCARTAWLVLNDLGRISLSDMAYTLHVVSVRIWFSAPSDGDSAASFSSPCCAVAAAPDPGHSGRRSRGRLVGVP